MELSVREFFRRGETAWEGYISWIGLSQLAEVRTGDAALNPYDGEPVFLYPPADDFLSALCLLPEIDATRYYYLLAVNLAEEALPTLSNDALLLGYDLADGTSSLLNCGPWEGKLAPIAKRVNQYGLLTFDDAQLAQKVLPEEWGEGEPHAFVDIWALYDVLGLRPAH